jgi:hypothetical protein
MYENVTSGTIDVHALNLLKVENLRVTVTAADWTPAGYGGALSELTADERRKLHEAILAGLRVEESEEGTVLVVELASIKALMTSSQPAVDDEVSIDSVTGVKVAPRSSVLMRGLRVEDRNLLVSLYEDAKSGAIAVHAFDLLAVENLMVIVSEEAWSQAGYGGGLARLTAEEKQRLHEAIMDGLSVLESETGRMLQVNLAVPVVRTVRHGNRSRMAVAGSGRVVANSGDFRAIRAGDFASSVQSGMWLPNAPGVVDPGRQITVDPDAEDPPEILSVIGMAMVEIPPAVLDVKVAVLTAEVVESQATKPEAQDGIPVALPEGRVVGVVPPQFCRRSWKAPEFSQLPSGPDVPVAYVVNVESPALGDNVAQILERTSVESWTIDPAANNATAAAHQEVTVDGQRVLVTVVEKQINDRLTVHLTFQLKDDGEGKQHPITTEFFSMDQVPPTVSNGSVIITGGSASFEECVFEAGGPDPAGAVIMTGVDVTFKDCIFTQGGERPPTAGGEQSSIPPVKYKKMTVTRGLTIKDKRLLASVYDQDGSLGVHAFDPEHMQTFVTEVPPARWAQCGYTESLSEMGQKERMQLYNAVFTGVELVPIQEDTSVPVQILDGQEPSWRLNVHLSPIAPPGTAVVEEVEAVELSQARALGHEEEDLDDLASVDSAPGLFPGAITRGVMMDGRKMLVTMFESKTKNEVHIQAFDPNGMQTYTVDITSELWKGAGYPADLDDMFPEEKKKFYNDLFGSLDLVPMGAELDSKKILRAVLPQAVVPATPVQSGQATPSTNSPRGPISVTRGLVLNNKRMLVTIFEEGRLGKLEVQVFDPTEVQTYKTDAFPAAWEKAGFPTDLRSMGELVKIRLYDAIFSGVLLVPVSETNASKHRIELRLDSTDIAHEISDVTERRPSSAGRERLRSSSFTRGQKVSGRKMLLTVYENGRTSSSLTLQAFDPVSVQTYSTVVPEKVWIDAGYGPKLTKMTEVQRCRLLDAVMTSAFLVLDPDTMPLGYKLEVQLERLRRRSSQKSELDMLKNKDTALQHESMRGLKPRSITRGVKLKGRRLLVTAFEDFDTNCIEIQAFDPLDIQTYNQEVTSKDWSPHGFNPDLKALSEPERMRLYNLIYAKLRLRITPQGNVLDIRLRQAEQPLKKEDSKWVSSSKIPDDEFVSVFSGSQRNATATSITRGVKMGGRRMLVTVFEDRVQNRLELQAFDPLHAQSYTTSMTAKSWEPSGFPAELSAMSAAQSSKLYSTIFRTLRLRSDPRKGGKSLTVDLEAINAPAKAPASELMDVASPSSGKLSITKGVQIGRQKFFATIFQGEEKSLSVQAFDTKEMQTFMAEVKEEQWSELGYGQALAEMTEAQKLKLYDGIFRGLHMSKTVADGQLKKELEIRLHPAATEAKAAAPSEDEHMQSFLTRGIKYQDRHLLASFYNGNEVLEVTVFDPLTTKSFNKKMTADAWAPVGFGPSLDKMDFKSQRALCDAVISATTFQVDNTGQITSLDIDLASTTTSMKAPPITGQGKGPKKVVGSKPRLTGGNNYNAVRAGDFATSVRSGNWIVNSDAPGLVVRQIIADPDQTPDLEEILEIKATVSSVTHTDLQSSLLVSEPDLRPAGAVVRGVKIGDDRRVLVTLFESPTGLVVQAFDPATVDTFTTDLPTEAWTSKGYGADLSTIKDEDRTALYDAVFESLRLDGQAGGEKLAVDLPTVVVAQPIIASSTQVAPADDDDSLASQPGPRRPSASTRGVTLGDRKFLVSLYEGPLGEKIDVQAFEPLTVEVLWAHVPVSAWAALGYGPELPHMDPGEKAALYDAVFKGLSLLDGADGAFLHVKLRSKARSASKSTVSAPAVAPEAAEAKPMSQPDEEEDSLSGEPRPEPRHVASVRGVVVNGKRMLISIYENASEDRLDVQAFDPAIVCTSSGELGPSDWKSKGYGGSLSELGLEAKAKLFDAVFASLHVGTTADGMPTSLKIEIPALPVTESMSIVSDAASHRDSLDGGPGIRDPTEVVRGVRVGDRRVLVTLFESPTGLVVQAFDPVRVDTFVAHLQTEAWTSKGYGAELSSDERGGPDGAA